MDPVATYRTTMATSVPVAASAIVVRRMVGAALALEIVEVVVRVRSGRVMLL